MFTGYYGDLMVAECGAGKMCTGVQVKYEVRRPSGGRMICIPTLERGNEKTLPAI